MKKIGITGPIGAGKSYISKLLNENHGIPIFNSDMIAKRLQNENNYIELQIIEAFGPEAYDCGEIDKEFIKRVIFSSEANMERMNDIIRGGLINKMYEDYYFHKYLNKNKPPFMVVENAIMMNESVFHLFDFIIIVDAPLALRQERVTTLRGMEVNDFLCRDAKQKKASEMSRMLEKAMIPYTIIQNDNKKDLVPIVKSIAKIHGWKERDTE